MKEVLTQTWALVGNRILAQADGSSGPEMLCTTSSSTVTAWPLLRRATISLLSLAWPRTLTWLASTTAGPATNGTVLSSAIGSFFFGADFFSAFLPSFFWAAGGLVLLLAASGAGLERIGAAGGGFVTGCAITPVVNIAPKSNQKLIFITQHSRDLISGSVNVRHLPGRSS